MKVVRSALLPYSAQQMYNIVADIESYPEFLNWFAGADILERNEALNEVVAKLKIAYGALNIQFTTLNRNTPNQAIEMQLVKGPFSKLTGAWQFKPLNKNACKVSIEMDFDFDKNLSTKILGKVFEKTITMQLTAFEKRAKQLYGDANA